MNAKLWHSMPHKGKLLFALDHLGCADELALQLRTESMLALGLVGGALDRG